MEIGFAVVRAAISDQYLVAMLVNGRIDSVYPEPFDTLQEAVMHATAAAAATDEVMRAAGAIKAAQHTVDARNN